MTKKILNFLAIFALITGVIAGGDDRDKGPVESLDALSPAADQAVVGDKDAKNMTLTDTSKKVIGHTTSGTPVTAEAHKACEDRLGLSAANIQRFKDALSSGFLYNTGPLDALGTEFSPGRWKDYFDCVENY